MDWSLIFMIRCDALMHSLWRTRPQIDRVVCPWIVGGRERNTHLKTFRQEGKLQILEFCAGRNIETQPSLHLLTLIDDRFQSRVICGSLAMTVAGLEFAGTVKYAKMLGRR